MRDRVRLVLPARHPAVRRHAESVPMAELADDAWTTGHAGLGWDEMTRRTCRELGGFEPDVRHRTNDAGISLEIVAQGLAVGMLPDLALPDRLPGHQAARHRRRAPQPLDLRRHEGHRRRAAVDPGGARRCPRGGYTLTSRVAAAFQVAVDPGAGLELEPLDRVLGDLRGERLGADQPEPHAVADGRDRDDLGRRAGSGPTRAARSPGGLDRDLPGIDAHRDRAGRRRPGSSPSRRRRARPRVSPPVPARARAGQHDRAGEVGDEGRARARPRAGWRCPPGSRGPRSMIPTRSPSCAASAKSCVTSSAGASLSRSSGAELARRVGARARVERGQRLVEQQHLGPPRERSRHRHPLALAAAERARARVGPVREPEPVEQLERSRPPLARAACRAAGRRRSARRSGAGTARSPGRRSRSGAAPRARRCRAPCRARSSPLASTRPCVGPQQPGGHAQDARLARPGRPGEREALARSRPRARRRARGRRAWSAPDLSTASLGLPAAERVAALDELHGQQDRAGHGDQHRRQRERASRSRSRSGRRWRAGRSA